VVKNSPFLALGATLCLLLSSCETKSHNPLSSPDTARLDQRLVGDWYGSDGQDTFHFTATHGPWIHVEVIPRKTDEGKRTVLFTSRPETYDLFPTVIGRYTYLNVKVTGDDDEDQSGPSYVFVRYTVSGDRVLQMWMISQDAAADAVRAGWIKGVIHQDKDPLMVGKPPRPDVDVTLQDTSANLVALIQNSNVKRLFSEKMETLYRVKPAGQKD